MTLFGARRHSKRSVHDDASASFVTATKTESPLPLQCRGMDANADDADSPLSSPPPPSDVKACSWMEILAAHTDGEGDQNDDDEGKVGEGMGGKTRVTTTAEEEEKVNKTEEDGKRAGNINNLQTSSYPFASRYHGSPVWPTHDLWANELLAILLPTHPVTHRTKFLAVLAFLLAVLLLAVALGGATPHGGRTPQWAPYTAAVAVAALILWTCWYRRLLPLLFAVVRRRPGGGSAGDAAQKVWMDPRVQATSSRVKMHVPLRLFVDPYRAREAACQPCLARRRRSSQDVEEEVEEDNGTTTAAASGTGNDDDGGSNIVIVHPTPNVWLLDPLDWQFQLLPTVEEALALVSEDWAGKYQARDSSNHRASAGSPDNDDDSCSCSSWSPIAVPGNWMLQHPYSLRDIPIYTNQKYPFPCRPPVVPALNPTGVYRLQLDVEGLWPHDWPRRGGSGNDDGDGNGGIDDDGDQYSILLHGIESACWVYWNGTLLGYFQDSRLPSEFVIPNELLFLVQHSDDSDDGDGDGTRRRRSCGSGSGGPVVVVLHIVVARWSDGSYMEDQDHWWMAGIHRSVELVRRPRGADIMDYHVLARTEGSLAVSVSLRGRKRDQQQQQGGRRRQTPRRLVRARLYKDRQLTADGGCEMAAKEVWGQTRAVESHDVAAAVVVDFRATLPGVELWTAETPNLYTLLVEQLVESGGDTAVVAADSDGGGATDGRPGKNVVQCEACRVGFRTVEINTDRGGILQVNGRPITVCGINRHEHDPDHGKVVSLERMKQDIVILK